MIDGRRNGVEGSAGGRMRCTAAAAIALTEWENKDRPVSVAVLVLEICTLALSKTKQQFCLSTATFG